MEENYNKMYKAVPGDFYENEMVKANPLTKYYHNNRYEKIRKFITPRFKKGMKILDLGSGSSSWNITKLPLTALDLNQDMLKQGKRLGHNKDFIVADLEQKLPIDRETFDFVVMSEVIEHLTEPKKQIREAYRVLKKGGFLIVTVPLDTPLSPWQILLETGCFIRRDILGNEYFKNRCGHVQHFSVESIGKLLESCWFTIVEKNITFLNIGIIAQK